MAKKKEMTPEEKLAEALVPVEEQPYEVPGNWCWTYVVNGFANIMDNFRKPINATERLDRPGNIPYYGATGQVGWIDDYLTDEELVLLGEDGAPFLDFDKNKAYIITGKAWVNNHAHILKSNFSHAGNEYLKHYLNIFNYNGYVTGTTRLKLTQASMQKMTIPLPPLPEQTRIVNRIESLFAKLDEAKEKIQHVLDGAELRKSAILHKAFTGELTKKWRQEHGVAEDSWEEKTLNDIADYKKGPFGSSITKAMFVPKGIDTFKVYEQGNAIRKTILYGSYYITKEKYNELAGFSIKPADLIISCAGTIGEIYKLPFDCEPGVINQALMRVRIKENIVEQYFIYYFDGVLQSDVENKAKGTAIKNIPPFKVLKAMPIMLPTINEQQEIVRLLDSFLAKEKAALTAAEKALAAIETMKKSILARAFRGELGTNDPTEESATKLLKEILA